jgi:hypothetical protein
MLAGAALSGGDEMSVQTKAAWISQPHVVRVTRTPRAKVFVGLVDSLQKRENISCPLSWT